MKTYCVDEVAMILDVNPETIRRWLRSGKLKGVCGKSKRDGWTISESDIKDFEVKHPKYTTDTDKVTVRIRLLAELETYKHMKDFIDDEINRVEYALEQLSKRGRS